VWGKSHDFEIDIEQGVEAEQARRKRREGSRRTGNKGLEWGSRAGKQGYCNAAPPLGWGDQSHLSILLHDSVKDALVCRVGETTLVPCFFIILVSCAEPLWAKVKGIAEWFVNTSQTVAAGHEDLGGVSAG